MKFWLVAALLVSATAALVGTLSYVAGIKLLEAATSIGSLFTVVAVLLAVFSLRADHEWNRRHYTLELMGLWNSRARPHLTYLEHEFPEFFAVPDFIENPELLNSWRLDTERARLLIASDIGTPQSEAKGLEIRDHLIELLNYFEDISVAYELQVIDRGPIEDSIATVIMDVYTFFQPFIAEMQKANRRDPWPPLSRTVQLWLSEAARRKAQASAADAAKLYQEALKKAEEGWRRPTG